MRTRSSKKEEVNQPKVASPSPPTTPVLDDAELSDAESITLKVGTSTQLIECDHDLPHGVGKKEEVHEDSFVDRVKDAANSLPESGKLKKGAVGRTFKPVSHGEQKVPCDLHGLSKLVDQLLEDHKNDYLDPKPDKKKISYGLTPGTTPFPKHIAPSPEQCEEVNRLLSGLHGSYEAPEVIPAPSLLVTGCGEVPDPIDAVLRTLLSATTSAKNSNTALAGLKTTYGLQDYGKGIGSIRWNGVRQDSLENIEAAIKRGGLAHVKAISLKKVTNQVYLDNLNKVKKLIEETFANDSKNNVTTLMNLEITDLLENPLTLEWLYSMTTDEIMTYLTGLPGVGVKTAACVLLFNFKRPCYAVDTHVFRFSKWLGWVPKSAKVNQTFSHLEVRIPDHLKYSLHQVFLRHGKSCARCSGRTKQGGKLWDECECPIDHLVDRYKDEKSPVNGGMRKKQKTNNNLGDESGDSEAPTPVNKGSAQKRKQAQDQSNADFEDIEVTDPTPSGKEHAKKLQRIGRNSDAKVAASPPAAEESEGNSEIEPVRQTRASARKPLAKSA
ncbi:DNA glycosylase [Calycina marina]|uniref:DNA glycosylase n=1 Tax=Calycina marina TaxID=1763456 RepID=A0A9P7YYS9_9HELO|nr:DNA glycosylase [Calycina marina]